MKHKINACFLVGAVLGGFLIVGCAASSSPNESNGDASNDSVARDSAPQDDEASQGDEASQDEVAAKDEPVGKDDSSADSRSSGEKLATMNWTLVSVGDGENEVRQTLSSGIAAKRYKLSFVDQRIQLTGGCNNASSSFAVGADTDGNISVGQWISTKRACAPALMDADSELQEILSGVNRFQIKDQQLTLSGAGGTLLFSGTATAEVQFGGEGKRRFIDIRNTANGLVWREVKYNESWVRINKDAPWKTDNFPGIRDFTPELDMEYTVRIKEYQGDSGNPVWVKDMVVMQGLYSEN